MPNPPAHVTEAELAVLEILWEGEAVPIRAIADRLYPGGTAAHYATVQKLLERLEAKGFVRRERSQVPHRFSAKVDRARLIANRLRDVADTLCEGSMAPLLTTLVGKSGLADADIAQLRALLDELEGEREGEES